ncbi:MAG: hypothetical protein AAGA54_16610 [Myxococcota bacterium]
MKTSLSLLALALVVSAGVGCQRLDGGGDDGGGPSTMSAGNLDDSGGGTLLESGDDGSSDDGGGGIMGSGCDPVEQADCDPGEKCTAVLAGAGLAYACVSEVGTLQPQESCTVNLEDGLDGCVAGTVCLGDETGTCRPLCEAENDCTGGLCVEDPFDDVPHCAADCSPFEPSCPSPSECRRRGDRFVCLDPSEGDVGGAGSECQVEQDSGCAEGHVCVPGALVPNCETTSCCVTLCDLDSVDSCASPATCNAAIGSPAPGFESIGACFVPA